MFASFFRLYPDEPFVSEKIVVWKGLNKYMITKTLAVPL